MVKMIDQPTLVKGLVSTSLLSIGSQIFAKTKKPKQHKKKYQLSRMSFTTAPSIKKAADKGRRKVLIVSSPIPQSRCLPSSTHPKLLEYILALRKPLLCLLKCESLGVSIFAHTSPCLQFFATVGYRLFYYPDMSA